MRYSIACCVIVFAACVVLSTASSFAPLHVWTHPVASSSVLLPNAPSVVSAGGFIVALEIRLSAQQLPIPTLSGYNVSTGVKVWQMPAMCSAGNVPVFLDNAGTVASSVALGCPDALFFIDSSNGVVLQNLSVASYGLQLITQRQPRQKGGVPVGLTPMGSSVFVVCVANASATAQQGTIVVDTSLQITAGPYFCTQNVPLLSVHTGPGEPGYLQVCATYASYAVKPYVVTYVPYSVPSTSWSYHGTAAQVITSSFASASSLNHVAVAYFDGNFRGNFSVIAFTMGSNSLGLPSWSVQLKYVDYNVYSIAFIQPFGEALLVGLPQGGGVFYLQASGAVVWSQQGIFAPLGALPQYALNGTIAVVTATAAFLLDLTSGSISGTVVFQETIALPIFSVDVFLRPYFAPFDAVGVTELGPPQIAVALSAGSSVQFFDMYGPSLQQLMTINLAATIVQPSLSVLNFNPISSPGEDGLFLCTADGFGLASLAVGWQLNDVSDIAPRGTYNLVSFVTGSVSAIDRNGNEIWNAIAPISSLSMTAFVGAFGYRWMFMVLERSMIATYDTYTGQLVRTLLIPSDCYSNASNPVPIISGISTNAKYDTAYFSAGLPCLFSVSSDLTLTSTSLPWTIFNIPIVDEPNQMQYVYANHVLYAISTANAATHQVVANFAHEITDVIPSSWVFAPVANVQYPLVFVFTSGGVCAIDVFRQPGNNEANRAWDLSQYNIRSFKFFNSSLYTLSQSGICKISPQSGNVLWCHGALQVEQANVISTLAVSPFGELIFALDGRLFVVSGVDGKAPWSPSNGFIELPQGNCTQMTYANDAFVVLALCSGTLFAIDGIASMHPVLFVVDAAPADIVVLSNPTLMIISAATGVVNVYQMPLWVQSRGRAAPLPPSTSQLLPQTFAPGWTSAPSTPSPYLPSYPSPQLVAPPAATTFDPFSNNGNLMAASIQGRGQLESFMFISPTTVSGICAVSAFNVTSNRRVWSSPFAMQSAGSPCSCATLKMYTTGNVASSATVTLFCDGIIATFQSSSGLHLWNTSTDDCGKSGMAMTDMTQFTTTTGSGVVVGISANWVCGYSTESGSPFFALRNPIGAPTQVQVLSQTTSLSVAVAGAQGLTVISISQANTSSAQIAYTYNNQNNVLHKCLGGPSIILARPGNAADDIIPGESFYGACVTSIPSHQYAVFSISSLGSTTIATASSVASPQILELVLEGSWSFLVLTGSMEIMIVHLTGNPVQSSLIDVSSIVPSPYFITIVGTFVVALHFDSDVNIVAGFNTSSIGGIALQWVSNTSISQPTSWPQPARPVPGLLLNSNTIVLAAGGIAAFSLDDGTELWASHRNNAGMPRQIATNVDTGLRSRDGTAVLGSLVTFFGTSESAGFLVANPAPALLENQPQGTSCFYATYFDLFAAPPSTGIVGTALLESTVPLVTNLAWVNSADAAGMVRIVESSTANGLIAFVFTAHVISVFRVQTGEQLATLFHSEACPSSSGFAMQLPVTIVVAGTGVVFSDGHCLYRIDVVSLQIVATFLSIASTFTTTSLIVTNDNATALLSSADGLVAAVQMQPFTLLWISNQFTSLGYGQPILLSLPYTAAEIPSKQQLIVYSTTQIASLNLVTGAMLWVTSLGSTPLASIAGTYTNDGNAIFFADGSIVKVSLAILATDRVLWNMTLPTQYPKGTSWGPVVTAPNCRLVIAAAGLFVVATDGTTSLPNIAWMFSSSPTTGAFSAGSAFTSAAFFGFSGASLPPKFIAFSGCGTVSLELDSGSVIYSYEHDVATWYNDGVFAISSGYYGEQCLVSQLQTQSAVDPGTYTPVSPPSIPDGYTFTPPLPSSTLILTPDTSSPSPLISWQYMKDPTLEVGDGSGFSALLGITPVMLVLTFNGSTWTNPKSTIEAVHQISGTLVDSLSLWTSQCNARTLVELGPSFAGALCARIGSQSDKSATQYSLALISLQTSLLKVSAVVQLPFYFDDTVASIQTNITGIGCIYTSRNSGGSIVCVSLENLGSITASFTCQDLGDSFVDTPYVVPGLQMMIVTCMGVTGSHVNAVFVNNGTVAWSSTFGSVEIRASYYSSLNSFGAVLLQSGAGSNVTFVAFDLASGPTVGKLSVMSLPPATPLSNFLVTRLSGEFIFTAVDRYSNPNIVTAFSSVSKAQVWSYQCSGTYATSTMVLATDSLDNRLVIASTSASPSQVFVEVVSLASGAVAFPKISGSIHSSGVVVSVHQLLASDFCVLLDTSVVYVNLQSSTFMSAFLQVIPGATVFLNFPGTQQPKLLDVLSQDGSVTQLVLATWYSRPLAVAQFSAVVSPYQDAFLVATIGTSTYFLNNSGDPIWGVDVHDKIGAPTFDPVLFPFEGGVIIRSAYDATYHGFAAGTGALVFAGSLPICRGQVPNTIGIASAPDFIGGQLYIVAGNPCLYSVDPSTGVANALSVSSSSLLPVLTLSPTCIVIVDTYGTIVCVNRQSSTVAWRQATGYTDSNSLPSLLISGNTILARVAGRVLCLIEDSGLIVWEQSIETGSSMVVYNNYVFIQSPTSVMSVAIDPASTTRILWRISFVSTPPTIPPVVAVDGTLLVAVGNGIVGLDSHSGNLKYTVPTRSPCASLRVASISTRGNRVQNIFVSECGYTEIRAVGSGEPIVALSRTSDSGCFQEPIQFLQDDTIAFCNANGELDVQRIPPFIATRATNITVAPTTPPLDVVLPSNYVPEGALTPAPTFANENSFPDRGCILNINAMYPDLERCLNLTLAAAFHSGNPDAVSCNSTAGTLGECASQWTSNAMCTGAIVYLNTVVVSLVASQTLNFCQEPGRCDDGQAGATAVCVVIHEIASSANNLVLPSAFIASIPGPASSLPQFTTPTTHQNAPGSLGAGAIAAIVLSVAVVLCLVIAYYVKRKKENDPLARTAQRNLLIQEEGEVGEREVVGEERELISLVGASASRKSGYSSA